MNVVRFIPAVLYRTPNFRYKIQFSRNVYITGKCFLTTLKLNTCTYFNCVLKNPPIHTEKTLLLHIYVSVFFCVLGKTAFFFFLKTSHLNDSTFKSNFQVGLFACLKIWNTWKLHALYTSVSCLRS